MLLDNPNTESVPVETLRARAEAVLWVRKQMAKHGLTLADLVAAGCFAVPRDTPSLKNPASAARYRSADGRSWNGTGDVPDWLRRAVNAGQNVEHFRVG